MSDGDKLIIGGSPEARRPARCSRGTDFGQKQEEAKRKGARGGGGACSRLREVIGGSVMEFRGGEQLK